MTVKADLKYGHDGESYVIHLLRAAGIDAENKGGTDGLERDIICRVGDYRFSIEVKRDRMEAKTGNVAIEYWNNRQNKPSGIAATKADFWVFVLNDDKNEVATAWLASTALLRDYIQRVRPSRDLQYVGDGNASIKLYARQKLFEDIFVRFDNLAKDILKRMFLSFMESRNAS